MKYLYINILNKLLLDIPIKNSENVYGICFIAGPGFGKSTIAKILSKKLNLFIASNDEIRRLYDRLGFDSEVYADDIRNLAIDRIKYLLEKKISHIIDANSEFYLQKIYDIYKKYNAKLIYIKLECSEEEVLKRIDKRENDFGKNDNKSRATRLDYYKYLSFKKDKSIPKGLKYFTIDTDTSIDEIEKQVDLIIEKII